MKRFSENGIGDTGSELDVKSITGAIGANYKL